MRTVGDALRALVGLALPLTCASCGFPDERVCRECRLELARCLWSGGPKAVCPDPCPERMPRVHASGRYEGPLAKLVAAYKDEGRRDCAPVLGEHLARAVDGAVATSADAQTTLARGNGPILLVPVPSSRAARRSRGDAPLHALATLAAEGFQPREAVVANVLCQRRRVADQAGLGARDRAVNLEHSMVVRARWEPVVPGAVCVLVDDVLTTGATLVEAARALRAGGARATVAATICATQRRHSASGQHLAGSR
jgi:predicted amidophosphoribosyltransferase